MKGSAFRLCDSSVDPDVQSSACQRAGYLDLQGRSEILARSRALRYEFDPDPNDFGAYSESRIAKLLHGIANKQIVREGGLRALFRDDAPHLYR